MPSIRLRAPHHFERGFAKIRDELGIPEQFPDDVLDEAFDSAPADVERFDARHVPLVAVDPPGATDLDQAYCAQRADGGDGYVVHYAIADVGAFVTPGGLVDAEARKRGATMYSPDLRTPLHPTIISENRASLLAGQDRPALLWRFELDGSGTVTGHGLRRAVVQVRQEISYRSAQDRIDAGDVPTNSQDAEIATSLLLLKEIGTLRQQLEAQRGGVSLNLPSQEVIERDGTYYLAYDQSLPVEGWNAQISLMTGMVGGQVMYDSAIGLLRTLPPTESQDLQRLRNQAVVLGVDWPPEQSYADLVRGLNADDAATSAFLLQCARTFRGAGYEPMTGSQPENPSHGAIAAIYAHVTAPLRRLVDRFSNEILLALYAGAEPPAWAVEALEELPSLMGKTRSRERDLERAELGFTEALILEPSIGEVFRAGVVDRSDRNGRFAIQVTDPAVTSVIPGDEGDQAGITVGQEIAVRLAEADPTERHIRFEVA